MPPHPEQIARAHHLLNRREVERALAAFAEAAQAGADPDSCEAGRWQCLALLGRYGEAWALSDSIAARTPGSPARFWDGAPLAGRRVILRSLHGFGDALQMIRYAPLLRAEAASLCVEAAPELLPLLRACEGVGEVITWAPPPAAPPEWDAQVEIMELPWIFRVVSPVPAYLNPSRLNPSGETVKLLQDIGLRRSRRAQIGVSWRSSGWNPLRSVPLELLARRLSRDCDVYSLQQDGSPELAAYPRIQNIEADFTNLALRMAHLDLVITVDGVLAHLAGALGLPVLLLLPFAADWRWGLGPTTPWYPRIRLFRQQTPGDWARPIARIMEHLREG